MESIASEICYTFLMVISFKKEAKILLVLLVILFFLTPLYSASAIIPFGGQIVTLTPCLNAVIHTIIGPPTPGEFIWAPSTRTYLYGPPSHPGQWKLGTAGPPSLCILDYSPFVALPGLTEILLGTSI